MSVPASIMASDPNIDIIRRIIELRVAYEKLTGGAPKCVYVGDLIAEILLGRGFKPGMLVAGVKIIACPRLPCNEAICSTDERLFVIPPAYRKGRK